MLQKSLTLAIDFDGTLVENKYPKIGKPIIFAFETLRALQEKGFRLILWSYRHGEELDEAVAFCEKHGVSFYAVNKNFPDEELDDSMSRKILADVYIDDRNIGGLMEWGKIYRMLVDENGGIERQSKRKGLFSLFNK